MEDVRKLIKTASCIQQALGELRKQRYLVSLERLANLVKQFRELGTEAKKLGLSLARNWFSAADQCCSRANRSLNEIPYAVSRIMQLTKEPFPKVPELSFLVEELKQLQQEFGSVHFDRESNSFSVETDPVELDGLYLGPFRIELHLNKLRELYGTSPYCVVALDPHPAATDEDVTHPHVSNERLCEGDGVVTIRIALEQGRLCDFFTMVRSTLNSYNPDSPYVALDDWDGEPCYDCGYVASREDTYYCYYCEHDYCSECSTYCRQCEETVCLGCSGQCPHCEELVCKNCISRCSECEELCCESCLEDGLCLNCKEKMEKENEQQKNNVTQVNQDRDPSQVEKSKTQIKLTT